MQNTESEAHAQLDYAIKRGINFIDTAEMYPIPTSRQHHKFGETERYIGNYLAKHAESNLRSRLVIATKVMGYSKKSRLAAQRNSPPQCHPPYKDSRQDIQSILQACEGSLRRLRTDYIDLYQLHWPDRYVPMFGSREYKLDSDRQSIPIREILGALNTLLQQGKIRAYGLCNETTFGVCEFVRIADELGMARPATIQNTFCLLDRRFESELAEACSPMNFNIGLMAWGTLAGGLLTGKYHGKMRAESRKTADEELQQARFVRFPEFHRRMTTETTFEMTALYMRIAHRHGITACQLAHLFCKSRWFMASCIVGATCLEQLREDVDDFDGDVGEDVLNEIDAVHNKCKDCICS